MSFATFGNDLYSGQRSLPFIRLRRVWYAVAVTMMAIAVIALVTLKLNAGIDFRGGSQFQITKGDSTSQTRGANAVSTAVPGTESRVSKLGLHGIRVQTDHLTEPQTYQVKVALAKAYGVTPDQVDASFVGPSWGKDISQQAIKALIVFLVLVSLVMAAYFRTWKMAAAGLVALLHDLLLTVGVYALTGFEVTPATVIGFLTILGYSLYDTVVVFDKVRENTDDILGSTKRTYEEAANLAVNQTLVRSINTSVVALLPVASILFIGAFILGAGTLKDISLALFVGIAAGTYSSIFIATPLLVDLRRREPALYAHDQKLLKRRAEAAVKAQTVVATTVDVEDGVEADSVGAGVSAGSRSAAGTRAKGAAGTAAATAAGQRRQPRRSGKSRPGGPRR